MPQFTLEYLSKKQAKIYSQVLKKMSSLPWRVFIIIDSTVQDRAGLKSENVQKFNHGKGYVIGDFQKRIYQVRFVVPPSGGVMPPEGGTANFDPVCFLLEITIGHQLTNIVLFFNEIIIPLPPIPFYTKKYLPYMTEHDRIVAYLNGLNMYEYIGLHNNEDIAVLTDSGYDNKKIQNTVLSREWHFITALKSSRGLKSEAKYAKTPKSRGWTFFFQKR
ncbi:hypothetical protein QUF80_11075 [Desulfococcaceae bacterium HSG8]|nr:hypothetical protein [Desulfococcaceae bacterium HSG8]